MKQLTILTLLLSCTLSSWKSSDTNWIIENHKSFRLLYKAMDERNKKEYADLVDKGIKRVNTFFSSSYKKGFDVIIHPNRHSLDSTWQKDWNMPSFKSECWMVASGVATKLDLISPVTWDKEACEHKYADKEKMQQLITHELVHVYHGQLNASPDFSNVEGIDWFVEGLATYASGQCYPARIVEVKKAIEDNKAPVSLDVFWTGNLKYGLSGSLVMFIDKKYGRVKLKELLPLTKKTEILTTLEITEADLLSAWKDYIQKL